MHCYDLNDIADPFFRNHAGRGFGDRVQKFKAGRITKRFMESIRKGEKPVIDTAPAQVVGFCHVFGDLGKIGLTQEEIAAVMRVMQKTVRLVMEGEAEATVRAIPEIDYEPHMPFGFSVTAWGHTRPVPQYLVPYIRGTFKSFLNEAATEPPLLGRVRVDLEMLQRDKGRPQQEAPVADTSEPVLT
jgi:hypothetical protein